MKKQEKIEIIKSAIGKTEICRCYFSYDDNYYYYYPVAVNDKYILGMEEDDFILDGYTVRKISHLSKVDIKDDKCNEINKMLGVTAGVKTPDVDISSWQTLFNSLMLSDKMIIIEDEIKQNFAIGKIQKVFKNKLHFLDFDADGIWGELEIPYSSITDVRWDTRYIKGWELYLKSLGS